MSASTPGSRQVTLLDALANREFRTVWLADAQSSMGDQVSRVALAVLVYSQSGSATLTATVYAVSFLPAVLGGVLLAGIADRLPHRTTLITCNALRAGLVVTMAVPHLPISAMCALIFVSTAVASPFDSANSAMLADIFDGDAYQAASALRVITHQIAQIGGFAGGGIIAAIHPRAGLLFDAATFAVGALLVRVGVTRRLAPNAGHRHEPYFRAMSEGVVVVLRTAKLRLLLAMAWLVGLLVVPEGLAAPYVNDIHAPTIGIGLLLAAGPLGTAIGSYLFVKLVTSERRTRILGVLVTLGGVPLVICALRPALPASVLLWALSGASAAYLVHLMPLFVRETPTHRRGQAVGIAASGLMAMQGLGVLLGGLVASRTSASGSVALAGALTTVLGGVASLRWRRMLTASAMPTAKDDSSAIQR